MDPQRFLNTCCGAEPRRNIGQFRPKAGVFGPIRANVGRARFMRPTLTEIGRTLASIGQTLARSKRCQHRAMLAKSGCTSTSPPTRRGSKPQLAGREACGQRASGGPPADVTQADCARPCGMGGKHRGEASGRSDRRAPSRTMPPGAPRVQAQRPRLAGWTRCDARQAAPYAAGRTSGLAPTARFLETPPDRNGGGAEAMRKIELEAEDAAIARARAPTRRPPKPPYREPRRRSKPRRTPPLGGPSSMGEVRPPAHPPPPPQRQECPVSVAKFGPMLAKLSKNKGKRKTPPRAPEGRGYRAPGRQTSKGDAGDRWTASPRSGAREGTRSRAGGTKRRGLEQWLHERARHG